MKSLKHLQIVSFLLAALSCASQHKPATRNINNQEFPAGMVEFIPYEANPVFKGTGKETWDKQIRERGYILFEKGLYKMWYTGTMEVIRLPNI